MENLSKYSPTELLKMINDAKQNHDNLKEDILKDTYVIDDLEKKINEKLVKLTELEQIYVQLIEEMSKR